MSKPKRVRDRNWRDNELKKLIEIWSGKERQLQTAHDKAPIIQEITDLLKESGFRRDPKGVTKKIAQLRVKYREDKKNPNTDDKCPDYEHLQKMKEFLDKDYFELSDSDKHRLIENAKRSQNGDDGYRSIERAPRPVWVKPKTEQNHNYWENIVPTLSDQEFKQLFRLSRRLFNDLLLMLGKNMQGKDTIFQKALLPDLRLAVALYFLGGSVEYGGVAEKFGICRATVGMCVRTLLYAANKILLPKFLKFPSKEQFTEISEAFKSNYNYPSAIGVIGGCHVSVKVPRERLYAYRNHKGRHSVALLAICDAKYNFFYVQAGTPGHKKYSEIFQATELYRTLDTQYQSLLPESSLSINSQLIPQHFLASADFPLKPWLIKPFDDNEFGPAREKLFNQKHSYLQCLIDESFARLRGRWRRLLMEPLDFKLENISQLLVGCCILHNFCEQFNDTFDEAWRVAENFSDNSRNSVLASSSSADGISARDTVANYCLNNQYS